MEKKEFDKAWKDACRLGLGIYDPTLGKRIDGENLVFLSPAGKIKKKPKRETQLRRNLMVIEKVYKEKFGKDCPYELKLFEKDAGLFVERLIRAVEICTLKYVLNVGGALNINKQPSITKGRRGFLWED